VIENRQTCSALILAVLHKNDALIFNDFVGYQFMFYQFASGNGFQLNSQVLVS